MKRIQTLTPPIPSPSPTPRVRRAGRPTGSAPGRDYPIRIADYRKRAGLTQAMLARLIGCSREHLCRIERGQVFLTEIVEQRIADHLHLSGDDRLICFGYPTRPSSTTRDDDKEARGVAAPIDLDTRRSVRVSR